MKSLLDRLAALILLLLTAPLLLGLGLLVSASAGLPVFRRELCLGRYGQPFELFTFRTLVDPGRRRISPADAPRNIPLGQVLRRWRLDELPLLFNVLRGEMSLVGPTPLSRVHAAQVDLATLVKIFSVKPGIIGPASVAFPAAAELLINYDEPDSVYLQRLMPARLAMELAYIDRWGLEVDIKLLGQTAWQLCSRAAQRRSRQRVQTLLDAHSQA